MRGYGGGRDVVGPLHQNWGQPQHIPDGRTAGIAVEVFVAIQRVSASPPQDGPAKPVPLPLGFPRPHTLSPVWESRERSHG